MLIRKENRYVLIRITAQDLADLVQCLSGNHYFLGRVGVLQMDLTDGNTMSVKGDHSHFLTVDLKEFTAHQLIVIVVRDGKDRLADHFLQGIL